MNQLKSVSVKPARSAGHRRRRRRIAASTLYAFVLSSVAIGCFGTPVGVRQVDPESAYRRRTVNALAQGEPSNPTLIVLRRHDLGNLFASHPPAAIAKLHDYVVTHRATTAQIFALAEMSFLYAQERTAAARPRIRRLKQGRFSYPNPIPLNVDSSALERATSRAKTYYLGAAVYAYAFLFPENPDDRVSLIDPRARVACDIYNTALAEAFADEKGRVHPRAGTYPLPQGELSVTFDPQDLEWGRRELVKLLSVADFEMHGLKNNYRLSGIGAPLVAKTKPLDDGDGDDFISPTAWVAATLLLELDRPRHQLGAARLTGGLELRTESDHTNVTIGGRSLPVERAPSLAMAASLEESRFWDSELANFLGQALSLERENRLFTKEPHQAGLIPVVFVHGTNSSPARWADMVNDLENDTGIRDRFQFLFFAYDSGNPILYSSMLLRRALRNLVAQWDPAGADPCVQKMVVIGHSQGGLLTKMMVIEPGSRFWDNYYTRPFAEVTLRGKTRALIEEAVFVHPLPFVSRVVFIATPQRGSYLAGPDLVRRLAARLITLPQDIVGLGTSFTGLDRYVRPDIQLERVSTSIDNMSPGHPFIRTIASIPVVDTVTANSIIPVRPGESLESGADGVVKYSSAHIEGVESELVVRSGHSTQSNPHTIEEVRRILHLHATQNQCAATRTSAH